MTPFIIDLSLANEKLYKGCEIEEVAGRKNLTTPIDHATQIVGKNCVSYLCGLSPEDRGECVLTGPMAVWSYLVVFHIVVHRFTRVYYDDGRNGRILIAAHGS